MVDSEFVLDELLSREALASAEKPGKLVGLVQRFAGNPTATFLLQLMYEALCALTASPAHPSRDEPSWPLSGVTQSPSTCHWPPINAYQPTTSYEIHSLWTTS